MTQAVIPPIEPPAFDEFDRPRTWPKAIGIAGIILASLWIISNTCCVGTMLLMPTFSKMAEQQNGPMPDVMMPPLFGIVLAVVGLVWSVAHLSVAIMLLARKPSARIAYIVWAAVNILLSIAGTAVGVQQQLAMQQWAADNPSSPWAQQANPTVSLVIMGFFVLIDIGWAGFILVWFLFIKRDPREIRAGVREIVA